MSLTIGSMFSGYGGLDMAVAQVIDAAPAWFCEWDDGPARVLTHHWPHVPNHRDVTSVDWSTITPVDILTGGYPCQPFSHAGHRKGTTDERHLWPHIATAIRHLRPRIVLLENVAGHLTMGLDQVLGDLAEVGFNAEWTCLPASAVGAPHHRDRLFIFAYPDGERPQAERLARRPSPQVPWDHDMLNALAGLDSAADINGEVRLRWGPSGPAILTWALVVGRMPPPVVEDHIRPGPHPAYPDIGTATSPEFVEWMMGLPAGHVTAVPGLTRAQQLKALGNGVVPAQAAAALRELMTRD